MKVVVRKSIFSGWVKYRFLEICRKSYEFWNLG